MDSNADSSSQRADFPEFWGSTSRQGVLDAAIRYVESVDSFLHELKTLHYFLECLFRKEQLQTSQSILNPDGATNVVWHWSPPTDFNYSGFTSNISRIYEAWRLAKLDNAIVQDFDGESLHSLIRHFHKLRVLPNTEDAIHEVNAIAALASIYMTAVERFELRVLMSASHGNVKAKELHTLPGSGTPVVVERCVPEIAAGASRKEKELPFGLQHCDVPQTLKRLGKNGTVTIKNEDYWRLMMALMVAAPNAIPQSRIDNLFLTRNDRENAPKKLRGIIDALGLTVRNWTLMELDP